MTGQSLARLIGGGKPRTVTLWQMCFYKRTVKVSRGYSDIGTETHLCIKSNGERERNVCLEFTVIDQNIEA